MNHFLYCHHEMIADRKMGIMKMSVWNDDVPQGGDSAVPAGMSLGIAPDRRLDRVPQAETASSGIADEDSRRGLRL